MKSVYATCCLIVCLALPTNAQSGAGLAPEDAKVFIQADGMGSWIDDWEKDPLYRYLKENVTKKKHRDHMKELEALLGMTAHDIVRRYFGTRVIFIGQEEGHGKPGVLISTVAKADMDHAIDSIGAVVVATYGKFKIYTPEDGSVLIGYDGSQMAIAEPRFKDYAKTVLEKAPEDKSLADNATFRKWTAYLQKDRAITAYVEKTDETHAIGVTKDVRGSLDIQYTGSFPDLEKLYAKLGDAKAIDFGPLPKATIGATMLNIDDAGLDAKAMAAMDGALANLGKTVKEDILPKLDAPMLLFLGELPKQALSDKQKFAIPVGGFAIKVNDKSVKKELDYLMGTAVTLANVSTMSWRTTPMPVKAKEYKGVSYVMVDAGPAIAEKTEKEELKDAARISYGLVGNWYVICSHEDFFKQIIAAEQDPKRRLTINRTIPVTDNDDPVITSFTRMPLLAQHVKTWIDYLRETNPGLLETAESTPTTNLAKAVKGLTVLGDVMDFYGGISLQAQRESSERISAKITVQRR